MHVKEHPDARPATWAEREPDLRKCEYSHVEVVTAADLEGDDVGALDDTEVGFIAHCHCGHRTQVRYSMIAAQSAVCAHVINAGVIV